MDSPRKRVLDIASKIPEDQINPPDIKLMKWIDEKILKNDEDLTIFKSKITSRSAAFTEVMTGEDYTANITELENLFDFVNPNELILMKTKVGQGKGLELKAMTILHKSHANKALMIKRNFYESFHGIEDSDIISFDVPTYPKRKVIVDPREGERVTYVMGIDYYGEQKMSILRMAMEIMRKDKGGLGLHAGSKSYLIKNGSGNIKKKGMLIFGLSGTGKTTLTTHDHDFDDPEGVEILQDDINLISEEGKAYGTEFGFYVKCSDVPSHPSITKAVYKNGSIIENVSVTEDGKVDWDDYSHTYNSRAIVPRDNLKDAYYNIDLPELNFILFNTRRPELPPIGRLISPAQAAAYYGLGESIITSAEDPALAGQAKRVVGFDPFILGEEHVNINRMKEILQNNPQTSCYVVNTGYVGEEENDITVEDTLTCIEGVLKDTIEWEHDEDLGYEIPKSMEDMDMERFLPRNYYGDEKFEQLMDDLRKERMEFLKQYPGIDEDIIKSI